MKLKPLTCALNETKPASGPITRSFDSSYDLSEEEKTLYRMMALIPQKFERVAPDTEQTITPEED